MQERSVRFVAVFAVLAMIITPLAAVAFESNDSDAADSVDYTKYYYDQLGEKNQKIGQWIYDAVVAADGTTLTFTKEFNTYDLGLPQYDLEYVEKRVSDDVQRGVRALALEQPKATYWLMLSQETGTICTYLTPDNVTKVKVTVTFNEADYSTFGTKATADPKIESKLSEISSALDKTSRETAVRGIHDKLCSMLTYDSGETGKTCEVRSIYTSLVGTGHVVCEGYAKAFKALCDYNSIPCIILTGEAGTNGTYENHMWNYVLLENGCWYLVDVTWDDQSTTAYNYYLAGTSTMGFNGTKVGDSHDPTRGKISVKTGYGFDVPSLAYISANDPSYVVTFMSDGKEYKKIAVPKDEKMEHIENPTVGGIEFIRWCTDPGFTTPWDWNNAVVKSDMTLYAQFTSEPVTKVTAKDGDKDCSVNVISNTSMQLTELMNLNDSNKKFLGWNTARDGSGLYYSSNDTVTLKEPLTLYAVWEQTNDDAFSKTITQINEFLADDNIINGVSNTIVAIAVSAGVLLLIGFLLIRIKK